MALLHSISSCQAILKVRGEGAAGQEEARRALPCGVGHLPVGDGHPPGPQGHRCPDDEARRH
eukprot:8348303-Alexandrium_andersonii.AAC.1